MHEICTSIKVCEGEGVHGRRGEVEASYVSSLFCEGNTSSRRKQRKSFGRERCSDQQRGKRGCRRKNTPKRKRTALGAVANLSPRERRKEKQYCRDIKEHVSSYLLPLSLTSHRLVSQQRHEKQNEILQVYVQNRTAASRQPKTACEMLVPADMARGRKREATVNLYNV